MKKLILLFSLIVVATTVQGQSLTEKEITGTWLVENVIDNGTDQKVANEMNKALFIFNSDNSFELRTIKSTTSSREYSSTAKSNRWTYNAATQTINSGKAKMSIKVSKSNDKVYFVLAESGVKLEMVKPM